MSNRSIEVYEYRQIIMQMRLGESDRAISKTKLAGRDKCNQIRQIALKLGWLSPEAPLPDDAALAQAFKATPPDQKNLPWVTPYQQEVEEWYRQGINATTIHRTLIRKYQYKAGYDSVKAFVKKLKAKDGIQKASCILYFAPGEAAQVDFGKGPEIVNGLTGEIINSWFFVMTLCYSRHMYLEFVGDQTVETWLGCHRRAFEFFGGVPKKVIIDNPKCAITKACRHDPEVQRAYAECAEGYGFMIAPCPPRDPQKKGIVESGVKYTKGSFLPLRTFRSLSDVNQQAMTWVLEEAGNRTHGTTYQKPLTLFHETERHLLLPLPERPPELVSWNKVSVHGDCHVQYKKCRYSVPFRFIGQVLWLRASEISVRVYYQQEMIATHIRLKSPGQRTTLPGHLAPDAKAYFMRDPAWCRQQAEKVGEDCCQVVQFLFADKVLEHLRAVQGILSLAKTYGAARLNAACKRALLFNSPHYKTIKGILESGLEYSTLRDGQAFDLLGQAYTHGRFIRESTKSMH